MSDIHADTETHTHIAKKIKFILLRIKNKTILDKY